MYGSGKIAVVRANGLGDFIFSLPALESLKSAYPDHELVLLGRPWHYHFLSLKRTAVDRTVVIPVSEGLREEPGRPEDPEEMEEFFERMSAERFDIAVQLHGGGRYSNPFAKRLGAPLTVGMRAFDAPPLDRWVPYYHYQNEVLRYLEVVALIGARPATFEPRVRVLPEDVREATDVAGLEGRPFAVLNPSAGDPRRRWPAENFAVVADALSDRGLDVLISGSEGEAALAAEVAGHMRTEARPLCGRLTLGGLSALLSMSEVVVSNDSGPLHLAAAVGARTVGLFWCGNLINGGPSFRMKHRPLISWMVTCPVCGDNIADYTPRMPHRTDCPHRACFMMSIRVDDVVRNALELVEESMRGWCGSESRVTRPNPPTRLDAPR